MKNDLFKKIDKEKDIISIEKFIINYLNKGEEVYLEKMGHHDLRRYNSPKVIRVSYDFTQNNFDLLKRGTILMVKDSYGKVAPYINPIELEELHNLELIEKAITDLKKQRINQLQLILSRWLELEALIDEKNRLERMINDLKELAKDEYLANIIKKQKGEDSNDKYKRRQRIKCSKS